MSLEAGPTLVKIVQLLQFLLPYGMAVATVVALSGLGNTGEYASNPSCSQELLEDAFE